MHVAHSARPMAAAVQAGAEAGPESLPMPVAASGSRDCLHVVERPSCMQLNKVELTQAELWLLRYRLALRLGQSRALYEGFQALKEQRWDSLDPAQRRIVDEQLRDFIHSGVALEVQSNLHMRIWFVAQIAIHLSKYPLTEQHLSCDLQSCSLKSRSSIEMSTYCACLYRGLTVCPRHPLSSLSPLPLLLHVCTNT